ncbi:SUMF1/EgtB/PvdO family nonheme iron enzyme [Devosia sediminis]|uniref:SUMF1/EgtB/PvdO family nonheme iron enzyme n=1 Tax=Devosia sediminis TaxID=2798801 RepID=A0A934IUH0_9HYPH|nr:SUMF1/EgtB/PvdO family nonheme iron enzyme [Devosia sediminis]MBJ3783160.1 SUMF1/EgtB/PvdO family nonheme iron enzyme [Devosia sediminis]
MAAQAVRTKDVTLLLLPAILLTVALGALAVQLAPPLPALLPPSDVALPATVTLPPGTFNYRADGHFLRDNVPVDPPVGAVTQAVPLEIMQYQVSVEDYARCVADGACAPTVQAGLDGQPVTGVSYQDAAAYAGWLSAASGQTWTLPTAPEWAYAAAERYTDEALGTSDDAGNPALRWIANYRQEAARNRTADPYPKPLGTFGANSFGLMDIAGNVWEWTDTCHRRVHVNAVGDILSEQPACTIRVLEGKHRAATSFFIRDAKSGGCSVGIPPDNLGFRLVRRPDEKAGWMDWL